jgi:hypothetical protein
METAVLPLSYLQYDVACDLVYALEHRFPTFFGLPPPFQEKKHRLPFFKLIM